MSTDRRQFIRMTAAAGGALSLGLTPAATAATMSTQARPQPQSVALEGTSWSTMRPDR